jgi:hypothetical protein
MIALHCTQQVAVEGTKEPLRRVVRVDLSAAFPAEPPALSASEVLTGQAWQFDSHGLKYRLVDCSYLSADTVRTAQAIAHCKLSTTNVCTL